MITKLKCVAAVAASILTAHAASGDDVNREWRMAWDVVHQYTGEYEGVVDGGTTNLVGNWAGALKEVQTADGPATNPLYQDSPLRGDNPLYEPAASPGEPGFISSILIDVEAVTSFSRGGGIVHRDLATRNVLLSTSLGDFTLDEALVGINILGSDGPADYESGSVR